MAARGRTRALHPHAACAEAGVWLHGAAQERCIHTQQVLKLMFGSTGPHKSTLCTQHVLRPHGADQDCYIHTLHVLRLVFGITGPHKNVASTRSMCWSWCLAARGRTRTLYPHGACAGAGVWQHGAAQEHCIHTQRAEADVCLHGGARTLHPQTATMTTSLHSRRLSHSVANTAAHAIGGTRTHTRTTERGIVDRVRLPVIRDSAPYSGV